MTENKVIFENEPKSYAKRLGSSALIFIGLGVFLYLVSRTVFVPCVIAFMLLFDVASYELSFNTYEGWRIEGDEIVFLKKVFGGLKSKSVKLDSISGISYFAGGGRSGPARLIFQMANGKTNCNVYIGIFDLAGTLKFFQSKGIKVRLMSKDDEVQMYLDGKIASVPMTNE